MDLKEIADYGPQMDDGGPRLLAITPTEPIIIVNLHGHEAYVQAYCSDIESKCLFH